jgi:hypothetical protein
VGYWEDGLAIYEDGTREERASEEEEVRLRHVRCPQAKDRFLLT